MRPISSRTLGGSQERSTRSQPNKRVDPNCCSCAECSAAADIQPRSGALECRVKRSRCGLLYDQSRNFFCRSGAVSWLLAWLLFGYYLAVGLAAPGCWLGRYLAAPGCWLGCSWLLAWSLFGYYLAVGLVVVLAALKVLLLQSTLERFQFSGRMLAKALLDGYTVPVPLTTALYQQVVRAAGWLVLVGWMVLRLVGWC